MTTTAEHVNQRHSLNLSLWITLIRGILAIVLGLSLFFIPEKTGSILGNFMGFFWISTGFVSLRKDPVIHNRKWARVIAVVIIVTGVAMVTRNITRQWVAWGMIVNIVGIIIILTGLLHMYGGFRIGRQRQLGRTRLSIFLGVFEVVLGVLFLLSETGRSPLIYLFATLWALIGGALLMVDAIYQWYEARSHPSSTAPINGQQV